MYSFAPFGTELIMVELAQLVIIAPEQITKRVF
jgi:hypothetical protein